MTREELRDGLRKAGLTTFQADREVALAEEFAAALVEKHARTPLRGPAPRRRPGPKASYWPRDGAS